MAINFEDVNEDLRRISLSDRLDVLGTEAIETRFAALAAAVQRRVVVDLTAVSFLASMGIRALISNAKAQQRRGGRMVLFVGNNTSVAKVLETAGIDQLIPVFTDATAAERAALA
jgi:anti-sigma B factor antagonist